MPVSRDPFALSAPTIVFPSAHSLTSVRSPQPNPSGRPPLLPGRRWFLAVALALLAGRSPAQTATPADASAERPAPSAAAVLSSDALKKMSLQQLMDLDVTSVSKRPEPYGRAPAAIDVITGDEIRRSGASSIPEALRLADNLDVAQVGSSTWDISARGFNSSVGDKLLVLIDGRSVYTPLFAGVIWNMQDVPLADIDRIEVISGPGGTLWGANAVNGVINIITKDAKETQGFHLEAGGGTWLQDFTTARYGGRLGPGVYYRVYGKYFDRGPEDYADGASAEDSWNRGQGGFRVDAGDGSPDHFTLQGDLFGGDMNVVPGGEGTAAAQGSGGGGNLLGRWTHRLAEGSDMKLQAYYDRTQLAAPFQSSGGIPAGTLFDDLDTYDLDFQHRFLLGGWNRVVWGMGYRFTHDVVRDAPLVAFNPGTLDHRLFSGFLQDEVRLDGNLSLTVGSKLEHNDYTGYEYEPSARVRWDAAPGEMLWAAVSRAVRMPARYDRDLSEPSPSYGTFLGGNSSFESETVVAYELGYRAQPAPDVSLSLSTFFNNYDRLRSLSFTPVTLVPLFFANNLEGQTWGAELTVDFQALQGWRLHGGYDLLQEDLWIKPGQVDLSNGLAETADPPNQVFLRSFMDLPGRTELNASFRWIDAVRVGNLGATAPSILPAYAEMDLGLGWHLSPAVEVSVAGRNLLHDRHVEAGFPGPSQEQVVRSVDGKVTCRF